ncbi:MAG: hypothetical protein HQK87_01575 [Nitrospinae bacterium]|nr:hypothetical protein [Nitrospinota bacterium]
MRRDGASLSRAPRGAVWLIPAALLASCVALAMEPELRLAVPMLTGVTAFMTILLATTLYLGERGHVFWSVPAILAVALLMRVPFLFDPPQLSDDLYRYVWDGAMTTAGMNPYFTAPALIAPGPGLAAIHASINHPDLVTIYPPAAQTLFAACALFTTDPAGFKAIFVAFDMVLCALLAVAARRMGYEPWRITLYAWHPLPVVEIAGSGHVDGAGAALVIAALVMVMSGLDAQARPPGGNAPFAMGGALVAVAGLVKVFPLLALPSLFVLTPSAGRRAFALSFLGMAALITLPYGAGLPGLAGTMETYARHWEFAGFAFNVLRLATGSGDYARSLLAVALVVTAALSAARLKRAIGAKTPVEALGKATMRSCYSLTIAFCLLTPTLQPWYAILLVTFFPFAAGPAGLTLSWAVFLTYHVQIGSFILGAWTEDIMVTSALFLAPCAVRALALALPRLKSHSGACRTV